MYCENVYCHKQQKSRREPKIASKRLKSCQIDLSERYFLASDSVEDIFPLKTLTGGFDTKVRLTRQQSISSAK